ncbi:MAG: hypothetical protein RR063_01885 [Anaerovoracaceae bacterium]
MNTNIKKIICIILAFILAGTIFLLYQNNKIFNEVIFQELRGIQWASAEIAQQEIDVTDDAEYEAAMQNYFGAVRPCINAKNAISENNLIYKKYNMPNFDNFTLEEVLQSTSLEQSSLEERQKCVDTIIKISRELEKLSIFTVMDTPYNFIFDKEDVSKTVEKIETICKEWK